MIAFIEGVIAQAWNHSCILVTNAGLGYEIALPQHTFNALRGIGEKAAFYTSLAVREDAMELFGFETFAERQTFNILLGISKVGARTAISILSILRPEELREAVLQDNINALIKVPGIGQKTAQHIFLELKYKLASAAFKTGETPQAPMKNGIFGDTLAALLNLGYSEDECAPRIRAILAEEPDLDVGSAIRLALKSLAKGKI